MPIVRLPGVWAAAVGAGVGEAVVLVCAWIVPGLASAAKVVVARAWMKVRREGVIMGAGKHNAHQGGGLKND
jgi:hypothetical protein